MEEFNSEEGNLVISRLRAVDGQGIPKVNASLPSRYQYQMYRIWTMIGYANIHVTAGKIAAGVH